LKHSRVVFPFNKNEQTQLEKYSKANYKIIPSPIDSKVFKPKRVEKDKFTITYAGTLLPWKGSLIAMKIFKEIEKERKDVNFTIIGRGPLENQLKKNAGKHFTFLKELTAEQLSTQYNTSDILVSPTYYESFGCVLAEAGMCGTPVVSTNVGAVPETVGKGGLLVNYGQWEKMKKLILMLLDDDKLRKKLGKDSIKHTQQYRDDVVSNKIYKNYKSVLNTGEKI
jgi:glycosyltransferase involved in cell wall biosynthesis